jgi:DNA-binding protein YbaB
VSNAGYDMIMEAAAELDRKQQRLREIRDELARTSTTASAPDRSITVELDAAGELTSIKFNSQRYRRMAPAELSAVLIEVIRRARAESRQRMASAFKDMLPAGLHFDDVKSGKPDLDQMFDDARDEVRELVAGLRAPDGGPVAARITGRGGSAG